MIAGRPLRFLAAILVGWGAMRAVWLWPQHGRAAAPAALAEYDSLAEYRAFSRRYPIQPPLLAFPPLQPADLEMVPSVIGRSPIPQSVVAPRGAAVRGSVGPPPDIAAPVPLAAAQATPAPPTGSASFPGIGSPSFAPASVSRWNGSGWAILRGGGAPRDFAGGRLGAAQAGVRLTYAFGEARRWAVAGRVSSPIEGRGREAALGLEWRPTRLPVRLLAEQRFGLDRGVASGPALSLVGGVAQAPVVAGFRLDGYAQAGIARIGGFADGGVWLARPVAEIAGLRLDLGIGAWGGAQPRAARLDVGPGAALAIPLADRRLRLGLEWRQRVAGRAAPGSGLALTIGSDF